jgi:hypothetical protein
MADPHEIPTNARPQTLSDQNLLTTMELLANFIHLAQANIDDRVQCHCYLTLAEEQREKMAEHLRRPSQGNLGRGTLLP